MYKLDKTSHKNLGRHMLPKQQFYRLRIKFMQVNASKRKTDREQE